MSPMSHPWRWQLVALQGWRLHRPLHWHSWWDPEGEGSGETRVYDCMKDVLLRWRKFRQSVSPHLVPNGCDTLMSPASSVTCRETKPTVRAATVLQLCQELRWAWAAGADPSSSSAVVLGAGGTEVTSVHFRAALRPVGNNTGQCFCAAGERDVSDGGGWFIPFPLAAGARSVRWQRSLAAGGCGAGTAELELILGGGQSLVGSSRLAGCVAPWCPQAPRASAGGPRV